MELFEMQHFTYMYNMLSHILLYNNKNILHERFLVFLFQLAHLLISISSYHCGEGMRQETLHRVANSLSYLIYLK